MSTNDLDAASPASELPRTPLTGPSALETAMPAPAIVSSPQRSRPALSENVRQLLAVLFVSAYVTCVMVEPMPDGPEPAYHLWMLPFDLGSLAAVLVAAVLVWRGQRFAAPIGIAAGLLMCVETVLCPGTGHHMMGGFLFVQAALSLFVLLTSAALPRLGLPFGRRPH